MLRAMSKEWAIARPENELRDEEAERYRVFVRDLVVPCSIGIYPREKGLRRRVRVNDETVVAGIKGIAEAGHINLVETLADRIATLCLADVRVASVRIVVEKLDVYPETESVGVVLERRRR